MGYLTPDTIPTIEDATYRGICVYVPDKPEYLRALMGSLHGLSQWVVWQKDDSNSAKKSADLFKLANALTMLSWSSDCAGCDEMAFDCVAMKDCLIEVAKAVSVNVTVNSSCNGSVGNSLYCVTDTGDIIINPPPVTDDINPPTWGLPPDMTEPPVIDLEDPLPPDGFDTWESFDVAACDAANTMVAWALDMLLFLEELLTERIYQVTAVFALVVNLFLSGWAVVLSSAMLLKIAQTYARLYSFLDPFEEAVSSAILDITTNRQDYVCMLYNNRANSASWENSLISALFNASSGGMDATTEQPLWRDLLLTLIPVYGGLNALYGGLTYAGDRAGFLSCAECDLPVPTGYILEPIVFTDVTGKTLDGAAVMEASFSGNDIILNHSGATGSNVYRPRARWNVNLVATKSVPGTVRGAMFFPRVHSTVGLNRTLLFDDSWGENTRTINTVPTQAINAPILVRHQFSDVPAETVGLENWVLSQGGQSYLDTANGTGNAIIIESTGNGNPLPVSASYRYSCWLLVKTT